MDQAAIKHVAALAELSLDEHEERKLAQDVGQILAYVAELEAVDTTDVPPTMQVNPGAAGAGWRDDTAREGLTNEEALRGAPETSDGGFVVPVFVE